MCRHFAAAPHACQTVTTAALWILDNKILRSNEQHLRNSAKVHIDDFTFVADTEEECAILEARFDGMSQDIGLGLKASKSISCTDEADVHGITWNLTDQTASIPQDKFDKIHDLISWTVQYRLITARALESLCGKLMHYAQLRRPAKALCHNLVYLIHDEVPKPGARKTAIIAISDVVAQDLKWWLLYFDQIRTVPISEILGLSFQRITLYTDASEIGGGWYLNDGQFGSYLFTPSQVTTWSINS